MPVTLTASLVPSGDPNPVQLALSGTTSGDTYVVTGSAGGTTWTVPGGSGVSTGALIALVDNRAALNQAVTYSAVVAGVAYASAPVTVVSAGARFLLQSLDGQVTSAPTLLAGDFSKAPVFRSAISEVPGRRRPPVRYATAGDGGGRFNLSTDGAQTRLLEELLTSGRPLVYRCSTQTQVRDLPLVDLILPTGVSSTVFPDGTRIWSLDYLLVDDPEPSTVLAAWTGDDFDAAMATRTGTDFDALFASSTWDDFDTYPWGQL